MDLYEDDYELNPEAGPAAPRPADEDEGPVWTRQRVFYLIIALLIIITLVIYMTWPLLLRPTRSRTGPPPASTHLPDRL